MSAAAGGFVPAVDGDGFQSACVANVKRRTPGRLPRGVLQQ